MGPERTLTQEHRRKKTRISKGIFFDKNLAIVSRGISKNTSKGKVRDKTKENLERLLEDGTVNEIIKVAQVDTSLIVVTNHYNENFHC